MDFKNHLAMLKKKLRNGLQMLRKHRTVPQLAKKNIYFALCLSHMIYSACILKNVTRKEQKDVEKIKYTLSFYDVDFYLCFYCKKNKKTRIEQKKDKKRN